MGIKNEGESSLFDCYFDCIILCCLFRNENSNFFPHFYFLYDIENDVLEQIENEFSIYVTLADDAEGGFDRERSDIKQRSIEIGTGPSLE